MKLALKRVIVISLAALLLGAAYYLFVSSNTQSASSNGAQVKEPDDNAIPAEKTTKTAIQLSMQAGPKSIEIARRAEFNTSAAKRLAAELSSSKDLKAFYDKYKNDTSPEGKTYFAKAMDGCARFIHLKNNKWDSTPDLPGITPDHPDFAPRAKAYEELASRCEGFFSTDAKQNWSEFLAARTKAKAEPGALVSANIATMMLLSNEKNNLDEDANKEAIKLAEKVLSSKDPDAIYELRGFFDAFWDHKDFHNTNMKNDRDIPNLRKGAFTLAACEMGKDCSKDSLEAVASCIYSIDSCNQPLNSLLKSGLTSEQKNLLEQYKHEILQAINSGDYRQLGLTNK